MTYEQIRDSVVHAESFTRLATQVLGKRLIKPDAWEDEPELCAKRSKLLHSNKELAASLEMMRRQ
jgi:hypothetical protein